MEARKGGREGGTYREVAHHQQVLADDVAVDLQAHARVSVEGREGGKEGGREGRRKGGGKPEVEEGQDGEKGMEGGRKGGREGRRTEKEKR